IRLQSEDFDAYLQLLNEDREVLAKDDDSGGGTDALLRYTFPYTGPYWVVASTVFGSGAYSLSADYEQDMGVDIGRALQLIELLRYPGLMSDTELRETTELLRALHQMVVDYRWERL